MTDRQQTLPSLALAAIEGAERSLAMIDGMAHGWQENSCYCGDDEAMKGAGREPRYHCCEWCETRNRLRMADDYLSRAKEHVNA